ncbi:hypothetical protein BKA67DRAFT_584118 [Truncatella angustata]|uniref:Uncharacterized protein n=1 Tax=Truncatella angustata TaxID=152316 RepID=A0A9P8UCX3_9PEZI|nr:uncharacterized protein BKA67DRAFT_584118 [Truncatella angustata]KAH6646387.1 hypothetical protein BKA67DRAFT_584118 [Truncatella angustata]
MNKTGEHLQALSPTFAGDELVGLKVDKEIWCIPLLALHRVSPEQMSSLWEWERTRPYNQVRKVTVPLCMPSLISSNSIPSPTPRSPTIPFPASKNHR